MKNWEEHIANSAEVRTNKILLSLLDQVALEPYFKYLPKASLVAATGVPLKLKLYEEFYSNAEYGLTMAKIFHQGNDTEILKYHTEFVERVAPSLVKQILQQQHPKFIPQVQVPTEIRS